MNEKIRGKQWEEKYRLAKEYYLDHGNLKIPQNYIKNGISLGLWITTQRQVYAGKRKGNLNETKIKRLEQIGMIWEPEGKKRVPWENYYCEAEKYYKEHGNLRVPLLYSSNGLNLGRWVDRQRLVKRGNEKGILTETQIELLNNIGMNWGKEKSRNEKIFEAWYAMAKEYYKKNGNLMVVRDYEEDGARLGCWINDKRRKYREGRLSDREIKLLEQIGMEWKPQQSQWQKYYKAAKEYYEEKGHLLVREKEKYKQINLGTWITHQRMNRRHGKLSKEKIELLNNIGMEWNVYYR